MSSSKLFKLLMSGIVVGVIILLIVLPITTFAKKQVKVGYYNLETIQKDLPDFQQLRELIRQNQTELENLRGNLYREYQLFYQELAKKTAAEKKGKSTEEQNRLDKLQNDALREKISAINRQIDRKQKENERSQNEQTLLARENLEKLIAVVAAKKKLDLVVDKKEVFYGENDITELIIAQAKKDAEKAARGATPKPTPVK